MANPVRAHAAWKRGMRLRYGQSLGRHTDKQWAWMKLFYGRCVRCGDCWCELEKDHIQPLAFGGSDSIENLQPLCQCCNNSKGAEEINWRRYRELFGWGLLIRGGGSTVRRVKWKCIIINK